MKAIVVKKYGGVSQLEYEEKWKKPEPKEDEILIKVVFASVNMIDTYHRRGIYPLDLPAIIGSDGAGDVVKVGKKVKKFKVGDRVAFFSLGSYAEYICIKEGKSIKLPDEISYEIGTAAMINGLTAHYLVNSTYTVKKNDFILCHAISGGVGQWVAQLAKLKGAIVIGTCSTQAKQRLAKMYGVDHVINYVQDDFEEKVKEITKGKGVKVVYDGVGKSTYQKSMKCLAPRGFLVLFGNASGVVPPIDPLELTRHGSIFMTRPTLRNHINTYEGEKEERANELFELVKGGKVKVIIHKTFDLKDVQKAHMEISERKTLGKILIKI